MVKKRNHDHQESQAKYHQLRSNKDGFQDLQFKMHPSRIPYKAIILASLLFVVGFVLILISILLMTGHIDVQYSDRMWPLLILGSLMFIPGSYHIHIAFRAWKGAAGYSFDDIPEFD